jgi:hypothetical protein
MWRADEKAIAMPDPRDRGIRFFSALAPPGGRHADVRAPHARRNGTDPSDARHSDAELAASRSIDRAITRRWIWFVPS